MRRTILLTVLSLAGALLNVAIYILTSKTAGLPLYLDTILTVSLTLTGGLFWGLLTGALTNIITTTLYFSGWVVGLFIICNMATALVTWLFIRFFPRELNLSIGRPPAGRLSVGQGAEMPEPPSTSQRLSSRRLAEVINRMIILILLSFCLCLVISVLGGVIAAFIQRINPALSGKPYLTGDLTATMFGQNIPKTLAEILSRIPVNIVDRLITAFAGFGIAVGMMRGMSKGKIFESNLKKTKNKRY
jgi:hypothetical protein